jgi:non-ribosomal peptide synthetase component F
MVLLTGFNLFLSKITNQTDIITGVPAAGREHENLKNVIGFFINTVILRTQLSAGETFVEFLQKVQANTVKALEYQSYPLELIMDRLKREYPKIATFFNLSNFHDQTQRELENLEYYHIDEVQDVKFDLACYLTEYRNGIEVNCHYLTSLFAPKTIEFIMRKYVWLLDSIADNPRARLGEYVEVKERRRIKS